MMASDDATTDNAPLHPPNNSRRPPSLLHLTTQIVATNIEKYPAGLWGVLSESQWDAIVRARVAQKTMQLRPTAAAMNTNNTTAINSSPTRRQNKQDAATPTFLPSLSAKHLTLIEQHPHNTHLSQSTTSDELLWKHILNYKFRESGMNRPTSLSVPCGHVERVLRECADVLLRGCVEVPPQEEEVVGYAEFVKQYKDKNGGSVGREEQTTNELIKDSDSDSDNEEQQEQQQQDETTTIISEELLQHEYQQHMKQLATQNLETLKRTCYTLSESPMDVQLLAETKIGKSVSKAVKTLTKLKRMSEDESRGFCGLEEDIELREMLWKRVVRWSGPIICYTSTTTAALSGSGGGDGQKQQQQRDRREVVELTTLELLQKLLEDWKEMASDSGVEIRLDSATAAAAPPKKKKRRMETTNQHDNQKTSEKKNNNNNNKYSNIIRVTTCGRDKQISLDQHLTDMNLLHNSPDWRSLYVSLINRELELRKSHGERVRATREHLERDRPKIGKVILKRAVGRVRGGDVGLGGGSIGTKAAISTTPSTFAGERTTARQEAILNKSKGLRAIQKQRSIGGHGSTSSTKVAQIRQTSKVAAKWGKSSFGNSVASAAGSKSGVRKVGMRNEQAQVQVSLQNGKTMKLPSVSNATGKSTGKFSSLQQKMAAKSRGVKKRK
ncbi:hypothetical protein QTG54_016689 [Skeletonema marinoi]|uniref:Uncharacterized protein n=1 Tax=Skeletonema marinoi TaxID=267567 RepID=A0AAD9D4E1_9STRA|nr:hypothetical protein QTG54_016689 [Skeletonema marinoi]